jgi:phasin family protein
VPLAAARDALQEFYAVQECIPPFSLNTRQLRLCSARATFQEVYAAHTFRVYSPSTHSDSHPKPCVSLPLKSEPMEELVMTGTYDPNVWFDACRSAFAPVIRTHEEYVKTMDRIARVQYAAAGDVLELSLAQAHAVLEAKSPGEFLAKSTELGAKLGEKLRSRTNELVTATAEAQTSVTRVASDAGAKATESAKRAA